MIIRIENSHHALGSCWAHRDLFSNSADIPDCNSCQCLLFTDTYSCSHSLSDICTSYEFGCTDGSCVNNRDHCNGLVSDCRDGTDEIACTSCRNSQYSCVSGGCVESSLKCDGRDDCADGSDESNCSSYDVCECVCVCVCV